MTTTRFFLGRSGSTFTGATTMRGEKHIMRIVNVLVAITLAASAAAGQTKISGSMHCGGGKGDESHRIEVGDHPGHVYMIDKGTCTNTTPLEIAGVKVKGDYTGVTFTEIDTKIVRSHGSDITTMENGDKVFGTTQGTASPNDPNFGGTWTYTGGTGKFRGIKGKGTYKCKFEGKLGESPSNCEWEGEYSLPAK
jgi:hypothetical protein